MKWSDHKGKKLPALSNPSEIIEELNNAIIAQGIDGNLYYLHSEQSGKIVISNVPEAIYEKFKPSRYLAPENISSDIESFVLNLMENINIFHNNHPDAATKFADGKTFQLNKCHHNSTGIFFLINHLSSINAIKTDQHVQIVLGYIARKIPFGIQIGNVVIENNKILLHDWHIWNYVQKLLVDISIFRNGGLLPHGGIITSWGTSQDHIFIYPPEGIEYWGVAYENLNQFNEVVGQVIGFK